MFSIIYGTIELIMIQKLLCDEFLETNLRLKLNLFLETLPTDFKQYVLTKTSMFLSILNFILKMFCELLEKMHQKFFSYSIFLKFGEEGETTCFFGKKKEKREKKKKKKFDPLAHQPLPKFHKILCS